MTPFLHSVLWRMESGISHSIPLTASWVNNHSQWARSDLPKYLDTVHKLISNRVI